MLASHNPTMFVIGAIIATLLLGLWFGWRTK